MNSLQSQLIDEHDTEEPEIASTTRLGSKRPAPRGTAAYPRKRAVTACQVCRARRTKCDNRKPKCSFCLKTGANCIQTPVDLSSFDPASLHILEQLDELKQLVVQCTTTIPPTTGVQASPPAVGAENELSWLLPKQPEALLALLENGEECSLLSILKMQDVCSPMSVLASPSTRIGSGLDLDPRTCTTLADNFFNFVHVKNPILEEEVTRRMIRNVSIHGADWSTQSCLALLVCALGSIATPFGPSDGTEPGSIAYSHAQSSFQAAQKRLGACLTNNGVLEAQCLFLAGVYLMSAFKPYEAWRLFSQSLAACQSFSFLCEQNVLAGSGDENSVAEQSIYWSAWKSEQEIRMNLMPHDFGSTRVREDLYPAFFPTPPVSTSTPSGFPEESHAHREQTGWYFYLTEISLRRLQHRMAYQMLKHVPDVGCSLLEGLANTLSLREAEVQEWKSALPANMSLDTPPNADDVCKFVLRGHLCNLYEMIHWPFLHAVVLSDNPLSSPSSLVSRLAEKALRLHVERIEVNRPGFRHRHHGTWPMIRTCSRSALVLLQAALKVNSGSLFINLPEGWRTAVKDVVELNRYWQGEAPDARHRLPILDVSLARVSNV